MNIKTASKISYQGEEVRVLSSDAEADQAWICFVSDPDRDAMVKISDLTAN